MRRYHTGADFSRARSIAELAEMARRRLPPFAWEYLSGGAEEEITLRRNRQAFADIALLPRTLVPAGAIDTRRRIFGRDLPLPIAIGPTGYNAMLWRDGDIQLARAAAGHGLPFCLSTAATSSMEDLARAAPEVERWSQLYCLRDAEIQEHLVARAEAAGMDVLMLTSDSQLLGNREWDRRNYVAPGKLAWRRKLDILRHPRWVAQALYPRGTPEVGNLLPYLPEGARGAAGAVHFVGAQMDASLDWERLARLRERWRGRLVLKGVLHPADAERAVALGLDGIVVSNHGGRQLDGVPASIDCLGAVAAVAKGKLAIMLDSGVRRGTDVLKACALGADLVLLGRAGLYGLAVGGQAGAAHAIGLIAAELRLAMGLLGCPSLDALDESRLTSHSRSIRE